MFISHSAHLNPNLGPRDLTSLLHCPALLENPLIWIIMPSWIFGSGGRKLGHGEQFVIEGSSTAGEMISEEQLAVVLIVNMQWGCC